MKLQDSQHCCELSDTKYHLQQIQKSEVIEMEVLRMIDKLARSTQFSIGYESQVKEAFVLGLWHKKFPAYMVEHLEKAYDWDTKDIKEAMKTSYPSVITFKFQFVSETGDSWHRCYQDIRSMGWNRLGVYREGGRLQYLLEIVDDSFPEGFSRLHLLLDISISTCKQVQVGSKTVIEPIYETRCEDLKEINEEVSQDSPDAEVITHVVIADSLAAAEQVSADLINAVLNEVESPTYLQGVVDDTVDPDEIPF